MTGKVMLLGGGEFQKGVENADREVLELAGGTLTPGLVLAVASSPRKTEELINDGLAWLSKIGAYNVKGLALNDHAAAENSESAETITNSKFIYLVGGDPAYISTVLNNSACLEALKTAVYKRNGVLVGSGSGAMVLTEYVYNPETHEIMAGLNFVPGAVVIPYHNSNGRKWLKKLNELLPDKFILGLDEKTAMLGLKNDWQVWGRSWVTVYKDNRPRKFVKGQPFKLVP